MCCGWGRGGGVEVGVDVGSYDRLEDVVAAVVDAVVVGRRSEEVLRCGGVVEAEEVVRVGGILLEGVGV